MYLTLPRETPNPLASRLSQHLGRKSPLEVLVSKSHLWNVTGAVSSGSGLSVPQAAPSSRDPTPWSQGSGAQCLRRAREQLEALRGGIGKVLLLSRTRSHKLSFSLSTRL